MSSQLPDQSFCSTCGEERKFLDIDSNFCHNCGQPFIVENILTSSTQSSSDSIDESQVLHKDIKPPSLEKDNSDPLTSIIAGLTAVLHFIGITAIILGVGAIGLVLTIILYVLVLLYV